jgi:transposase InsO family protein
MHGTVYGGHVTRECPGMVVKRRITSQEVIDKLFELFILRGIPEHIRSDNGPKFTARAIRKWFNRIGVNTLFIEPRSPWENGYIESFNETLRDELLNREMFTTLTEAKVLIEQWRQQYNHIRPHSWIPAAGTRSYPGENHELTSGVVTGGNSIEPDENGDVILDPGIVLE